MQKTEVIISGEILERQERRETGATRSHLAMNKDTSLTAAAWKAESMTWAVSSDSEVMYNTSQLWKHEKRRWKAGYWPLSHFSSDGTVTLYTDWVQ